MSEFFKFNNEMDENIYNGNSIRCLGIPEEFYDKKIATNYFNTFGPITRLILQKEQKTCIVEFTQPTSAKNALSKGGFYNGKGFSIDWIPRRDSSVSPDVQSELDSMAPPSNNQFIPARFSEFSGRMALGDMAPQKRNIPSTLTSLKTRMSLKPKLITPEVSRPNPVNASAVNELEAIMRKPAITPEERMDVLDARDKLIRLKTPKRVDIQRTNATQGVCPDMCPEKERYMRQAKYQVSSFEQEPNTRNRNSMNHLKALKQYSRSSADQESPLPHELRPEPTLKLAMDYLLHKIMDLCESPDVNIGDWFHFVWDRTRSIRKDVTQQELSCQGSVLLVEQCARFHIHCAGRLISEDPSVFDQKINTENLTKCLQSLKYMYHDLSLLKQMCPNEPEFRGYIVLMNLNDSNFLWEIKQLEQRIQKSPEIRFAIEVFIAMDNNNYVKFFQLVRRTTYMNACILLRYFNQVRTRALEVILKSYTAGRTPSQFTLSYFTYILAFEDDEATSNFLEYYSLQCDRYMDLVVLDKKSFCYPDLPFLLERAINVIEHKRISSVGEAICGKQLTPLPKYQPHDSFDENGYLTDQAWSAEDQNYLRPATPKPIIVKSTENHLFKVPMFGARREQSSPQPPSFENSGFRGKSPVLETKSTFSFNNVDRTDSTGIPSSSFFKIPSLESKTVGDSSSIFGGFKFADSGISFGSGKPATVTSPGGFSFNLQDNNKSKDIYFDEDVDDEDEADSDGEDDQEVDQDGSDEEHKSLNESEEIIEIDTDDEEAVEEEQVDEIQQKLLEENLIKQKEEKLKSFEENAIKIYEEMIKNYISIESKSLAKSEIEKFDQIASDNYSTILDECLSESLEQIIHEEIFINAVKSYRIIYRWRQAARRNIERRQKIEIENTPVWMPTKTVHELAVDLHQPVQDIVMENMSGYLAGRSDFVCPVIDNQLSKIDCLEMVHIELIEHAKKIRKNSIYWKIVFSIPDEEESSEFYFFINRIISKNLIINDEIDDETTLCLEQKIPKYFNENVGVCIRKSIGCTGDVSDNLNGLIFYVTTRDLLKSKRRLNNLIFKTEFEKPISLSVIVYENSKSFEKTTIEEILELNELINENKILNFTITIHGESQRDRENLKRSVENSLVYCARNFVFESNLQMLSSVSFLDMTLGSGFWKRILLSSNFNLLLLNETKNFNFVVKLFNSALERVVKILMHDFTVYPNLPEEFREMIHRSKFDIPMDYENFPKNWKNKNKNFKTFLTSLSVKEFNFNLKSFEDFQKSLFIYLKDENLPEKIGFDVIRLILIKIQSVENFPDLIKEFSWISIVELISQSKLEENWSEECLRLPHEIIYAKKEFREFNETAWWMKDVVLGKTTTGMIKEPECKRPKIIEMENLDEIISKGMKILENADKKIERCKNFTQSSRALSRDLDVTFNLQELKVNRIKRTWDCGYKF